MVTPTSKCGSGFYVKFFMKIKIRNDPGENMSNFGEIVVLKKFQVLKIYGINGK